MQISINLINKFPAIMVLQNPITGAPQTNLHFPRSISVLVYLYNTVTSCIRQKL